MKRMIAVLAIGTGLFALSACGGKSEAASEVTSAPVPTQQTPAGTPATPKAAKPSATPKRLNKTDQTKADRTKTYLEAIYKEEPNLRKNSAAQLIDDAKNICQYVTNAHYSYNAWFTITDTGEFAGVQNGTAYVRLVVSSAAVKFYCPGVAKMLAKTPENKALKDAWGIK